MRILLVDASPLMFKVFTGPVRSFSTSAGEKTGLRFGFLRALRAYEKKVKPEKLVVCWDAHGPDTTPTLIEIPPEFDVSVPPHRELLGASERGYKGNRTVNRPEAEEIWGGVKKLRAMVSLTRYTQAWADGYEADDVIGALTRRLEAQGAEILIVSPDRDLWQLFSSPRVMGWENTKKGERGQFIGPGNVIDEFGVPPAHLLFLRSVEGDLSDNLKGIGLPSPLRAILRGWLTALKPLPDSTFDSYREALSATVSEGERSQVFEFIFNASRLEHLRSNFDLMTLHEPPEISVQKGTGDVDALITLFQTLEMKSLVERAGEFSFPSAPGVESSL